MRYSSGQRGQTVNLLTFVFEGSIPSLTTILKCFDAGIAQLARASAFQVEGRGFESRRPLRPGYIFSNPASEDYSVDFGLNKQARNGVLKPPIWLSRLERVLGKDEVPGSIPGMGLVLIRVLRVRSIYICVKSLY